MNVGVFQAQPVKPGEFVILIREPDSLIKWRRTIWHPGMIDNPWSTYQKALEFARNEVGVPWIIVKVMSREGVKQ